MIFTSLGMFIVLQQRFVLNIRCLIPISTVTYYIVLVSDDIAFCRTLSTPNENSWPGVSQLPDYKTSFPSWHTNVLPQTVKNLDDTGLDLLQV